MLSIYFEYEGENFSDPIDIGKAVMINTGRTDRESAMFWIGMDNGRLNITGTYDEIQDFCSDIAQSLMSWPILNNRDDWFTDSESEIIGKVADDARADAGAGAAGVDGGSRGD